MLDTGSESNSATGDRPMLDPFRDVVHMRKRLLHFFFALPENERVQVLQQLETQSLRWRSEPADNERGDRRGLSLVWNRDDQD